MVIFYLPTEKLLFGTVNINFGENRVSVRQKLGLSYIEDNQIIQLSDSTSDVINQRRDIYKRKNFEEDLFFLSYDSTDLLNELEVHNCERVSVNDFTFTFDMQLSSIVFELSKFSKVKKISEGEFFFPEIKVSIMDKNQMGGEGNTLGYFYCADDVSHLDV